MVISGQTLDKKEVPYASVGRFRIPIVATLEVTDLAKGSFLSETKIKLAKDVAVNVGSGLLVAILVSIAGSSHKTVKIEERVNLKVETNINISQNAQVDVGQNLREIANAMAATGKPWELHVEDDRGNKVSIIYNHDAQELK